MASISNRKYLVTGAGGFVGSYLVKAAIARGAKIRAMIRNPQQRKALEAIGAEVIVGDIKSPESLAEAVKGVEGVFHIAALFRQAGVPDSEYFDVNVGGTRNVLLAAEKEGNVRVIHCSTVGVHGDCKKLPTTENSPFNPGDLYQLSKLDGELLARRFFDTERVRGVVIRPGMIYGPNDTRFLKLFRMIQKGTFFYVGEGKAAVHLIDVRDLADAFISAMEHEEINNEVYIISGNGPMPLESFVNLVADKLSVQKPWLHIPVKPMHWLGDACEFVCKPFGIEPPIFRRRVDFFTKDRAFDSAKAKREIDFKVSKSLEDEVGDIIDSYRSEGVLT